MQIITLAKEMTCSGCGKPIAAGAEAKYYSPMKVYHNSACPKEAKNSPGHSFETQILAELAGIRLAIRDMTQAIREK